ncbi:hypothetical protein W822_02735 [Advenella kashmirensis W13003]|uniref:Uncharacterized protein n=1 Tax=Advenella kashmirensis W13003 TaxID=1424334 RepID=V8QYH7_9BURK|nr:hypothetical protein W822_02735 [Advenella kashmirensis W13003]
MAGGCIDAVQENEYVEEQKGEQAVMPDCDAEKERTVVL